MSVLGREEDEIPFSVTHNQHQGSAILDKLRLQKDAGRFCDVVFHVQEQMYLAHRNVLAACSPYFDSVLKTNKVAKEHLTVQCQNQQVFKALLDYMYTGNLVIPRHRVPELLRLANHFLIAQLKQGCVEFLEHNITAANCFSIREQIERCGCQALVHTVESFILCNIGEIVQHGEVLEFSYSKLEQLISSKSYMLTENQRIALIIHWVAHCITGRTRYFRKLLTHVRWQTVNLHQVYELIQQNVLFQTSEYCLFHMLHVLKANNLLWQYYADTLAQLSAKLSETTGLDQEALVKLAIAGAFDATSEAQDCADRNDSAIISQSIEDDTTALHQAADAELAEPVSDTSLTETYSAMLSAAHQEDPCDPCVLLEAQLRQASQRLGCEGREIEHQGQELEHRSQELDHQSQELEHRSQEQGQHTQQENILQLDVPEKPPEDGAGVMVEDMMSEGAISGDTSMEERKEDGTKQRRKRKGIPTKVATKKLLKDAQNELLSSSTSQKIARKRGRPPKGSMQYSSKLKKQTVQVLRTESAENIPQGATGVKTIDGTGDAKLLKSEKVSEELDLLDFAQFPEDESGNLKDLRTADVQDAKDSDFDPYKCETDNEDEENEKTLGQLSKRRLASKKRRGGRSGKGAGASKIGASITAKKSRLKLVKKAIAKVKGEKGVRTERSKCSKCDYVGLSTERLEQHMKKAHKDDTIYQCNMCDFTCTWNREYYKHMKAHFTGPPYECDYEACDYVVDRIQPLLYHRMVHTDERPFQCTVCNTSFRTRNNLTTHLKCHTGVKSFSCEICDRSFATKGTLEQHSVTHSAVRPYLCDICGFSTKYQSHLIAHKRIHTGDVFKCTYAGCNYFTPKRSQLGAHMRVHLSIRSHICSTCGRAFVEKSHLVRHERIHLTEKPFKCNQCDYGSTRRDKLKEHMSKHHGEAPTAKSPYKPRKQRKVPPVEAQHFSVPGAQPYPQQILQQQGQILEMQQQLLRQQQPKESAPTAVQMDPSSQVVTSTAAALDGGQRFGLVLPTVVSVPPTSSSSTVTPSHQEVAPSGGHPPHHQQSGGAPGAHPHLHPHPLPHQPEAQPPPPPPHTLNLQDPVVTASYPVQDLLLHPHPHAHPHHPHPQQQQQHPHQQQAQILQQPVVLSGGQHDVTTLQTFSNLMSMWQ